MNSSKLLSLIFSSLLVSACAQQMGYVPTIDLKTDPRAASVQQDLQECQVLAQQVSGSAVTEAAVGTGVGAVMGAASGAVIGAVSGAGMKKSATMGAATGGLAGATKQTYEADSQYKRSYSSCMAGRGHKVIY